MPLTTIFRDTFTGTGAITAHTPDTGPAGLTYTDTGSGPNTTLVLDGTGRVTTVPVGYATGGGALANYSPSIELVFPYTITFTGRPTDTLVSSLTSLRLDSPGGLFILLTINHNAGSPTWSISVEVDGGAGGYLFFSQSNGSAAEHVLALTVTATFAALTVDGVAVAPSSSTVGAMPSVFSSFEFWVDGDDPVPHAYIDEIRIEDSSAASAGNLLPSLTLPEGTPAWLVAGHAAQWQQPFADVAMGTGHRRKRRLCTTKPQIVSVSIFLTAAQMTAFHAWFRDSTRSGERKFSTQVKEQGAGMLWYEAAFVGMYQAEALHLGRWVVNAQLILTGDGSATAPALGSFSAEVTIALSGVGTLTVIKSFSAEVTIPLMASTRFRAEVEIALEAEEVTS